MKIAVAQLNPTVGDLQGNAAKILTAYFQGVENGADVVVAPECMLTGYPIEDLVLRESFMEAVRDTHNKICDIISQATNTKTCLIYGTPLLYEDGFVRNCAIFIDPKAAAVRIIEKQELPNYGVFDEKRVFRQGDPKGTVRIYSQEDKRYVEVGILICEDVWFPRVAGQLIDADAGCDAELLISINGSPFEAGKNVTRLKVMRDRAAETGKPLLYVNMVGGQDELVFDGGSFLHEWGKLQSASFFSEGVYYFDYDPEAAKLAGPGSMKQSANEFIESSFVSGTPEIYRACVLGLRDYISKQGFKSVILGYSGGVDSGIVAAMACDALGADNVHLVRLPSKFSSQGSLTDAYRGAEALGTKMRTIDIEKVVESLRVAYSNRIEYDYATREQTVSHYLTGIADENIQARARGNILMAISNQEGHMVLSTGNKSEVSVGYATLYGDMSGGFNPIKDCYKTTVWGLCRWRNNLNQEQLEQFGFLGRATEVVPEAIIVKPPSAELRPDQADTDSLPPYELLDAMLKCMIEKEMGIDDIAKELRVDKDLVARIRRLVDIAEYKRRQSCPGVKITPKLFGRDRRYPIVNAWRG